MRFVACSFLLCLVHRLSGSTCAQLTKWLVLQGEIDAVYDEVLKLVSPSGETDEALVDFVPLSLGDDRESTPHPLTLNLNGT